MPLPHASPTTAQPGRLLPDRSPAFALAARTTRLLGAMALAGGCALTVQAQSLTELHQAAKRYDAAYLAAQAQYQASLAKAEQARAGLLPSAGLSAAANFSDLDSSVDSQDKNYNNQSLQLSASQPLYRPANRLAFEQARKSLEAAQAQLEAADQELVVRSAQAYFDVLAAQDSLTFVQAQKAAVSEQLAAAKRNFEVGTATITDTREAQARFDQTVAQEIATENDLRVKRLALDQLVGQTGVSPWRLASGVALPALEPAELGRWLERAETAHPQVRQAATGLEVARLETAKAQAGHLPTLDAVASYQSARLPASSSSLPPYLRNKTASIGVQFNLPLFAGFATQNRIKETLALEDKARNDLDAAKRGVAQATRAAYYGVVSGQGQVKALEAAEASSQSALEATQLGYQVGVRINLDVLNAQSQLFQTKASLAKARYELLVGGLRLKQAGGVLQEQDLQAVSDLLLR